MTRPDQPQPYPGDRRLTTAAASTGGAVVAAERPPAPEPYPGDTGGAAAADATAAAPQRPPLPQPYAGDLAAARRRAAHARTYTDVLGRPLSGLVTITGIVRSDHGGTVVTPAPVAVNLVDGLLEVTLPPGVYELYAQLRTVDGDRLVDVDTLIVEG